MAGALAGITVLELTRVSPGSFCTMMLADMGAEVLKIETPPALSPGAGSGTSAGSVRQAAFSYLNRNKRSLGLNLKAPEGQAILHQLAAQADVLVEGFRPGVMQRLNADYATLSAINPRLVYCSLSGFGQDGPYRDLPAHDLNYLGLSGVLHLIGEVGRPPAIPLNIIADYGGAAMHGVVGILLALPRRAARRSGAPAPSLRWPRGALRPPSGIPRIAPGAARRQRPPRGAGRRGHARPAARAPRRSSYAAPLGEPGHGPGVLGVELAELDQRGPQSGLHGPE